MTSSLSNVVDNIAEEFIKLSVNMYMIIKNVKNSKLDSKNSSPTLTISAPENSKNSIFEIPIIPKTSKINNLRTTGANSINLHTVRKLIENSL